MLPEERIDGLGYRLEPSPAIEKPYQPLAHIGNIIYGSGNTSMDRGRDEVFSGRIDEDVDMDVARERARIAVINCLSALKEYLGSLDRIQRIIRVTGYVNSSAAFTEQPKVINAASELLLDVFGERGQHARSAIGAAQLPGGATVEIELIVEVKEE